MLFPVDHTHSQKRASARLIPFPSTNKPPQPPVPLPLYPPLCEAIRNITHRMHSFRYNVLLQCVQPLRRCQPFPAPNTSPSPPALPPTHFPFLILSFTALHYLPGNDACCTPRRLVHQCHYYHCTLHCCHYGVLFCPLRQWRAAPRTTPSRPHPAWHGV